MGAIMLLMTHGTESGEAAAAAAGLAVLAGEDGGAGHDDLVAVALRHEQEALRREREHGPQA